MMLAIAVGLAAGLGATGRYLLDQLIQGWRCTTDWRIDRRSCSRPASPGDTQRGRRGPGSRWCWPRTALCWRPARTSAPAWPSACWPRRPASVSRRHDAARIISPGRDRVEHPAAWSAFPASRDGPGDGLPAGPDLRRRGVGLLDDLARYR